MSLYKFRFFNRFHQIYPASFDKTLTVYFLRA